MKQYNETFFFGVVMVCILCLFLIVWWVGLQSIIVAFPSHTCIFFL